MHLLGSGALDTHAQTYLATPFASEEIPSTVTSATNELRPQTTYVALLRFRTLLIEYTNSHRYLSDMSFGKLKSARKVRELQSFVKPADFIHDGTSPTTVTPEHAVFSSYEPPESTAAEEQQDLTARNAGGPDDEPHTDNPTVDGARNESLAEEELGSKTDITVMSGASTAMPGEDPAIQPAENKETPTLVALEGCHTSLPAFLEVRESARLGRGIYTKSALNAGRPSRSIVHTRRVINDIP